MSYKIGFLKLLIPKNLSISGISGTGTAEIVFLFPLFLDLDVGENWSIVSIFCQIFPGAVLFVFGIV